MPGHVFISYARADRLYVDSLSKFLTARGIPVWYDYELETGDLFWRVIQDRIDESVAVLVVLTPDASTSDGVWQEKSYASDKKKLVLPLLLKPAEPTIGFSGVQQEDVTGGKMPSDKLMRRLRGLVANDSIRQRILQFPQVGESAGDLTRRRSPRSPSGGYHQKCTKGAVAWAPYNGAQPMWGAIAKYYEQHKFRDTAIGLPLTPEIKLASLQFTTTAGVCQRFEGSEKYPDDVVEKWRSLGAEQPSGQRRAGASIYWSASFGAHATYGGIGLKYERLDGARGELGFPTSDETSTRASPDLPWRCYQEFERGAIFWSDVKRVAVPVTGDIWSYIRANNSLARLGQPIGPVESLAGRSEQIFEHGIVISRKGIPEVWWK